MEVKLIYATPINIALEAGLICTDSEDKIGNYDSKEFISKLVSQGHESIIEHINYNFRVNEISRACCDDKTEILTKDGFKYFKDLNKDDLIATLNPVNNNIEYYNYTEYIEYYYTGKMICGESTKFNFCVTPNHNMYASMGFHLGSKRYNTARERTYEFVKAEDIYNWRGKFYCSSEWQGKKVKDKFIINSYKIYRKTNKGLDVRYSQKREYNLKDFLYFIGRFIGDGYIVKYKNYSGHYPVSICGNVNEVNEIVNTFKNLGYTKINIRYNKTKTTCYVRVFDMTLYKWIEENIPRYSSNKCIPSEFLTYNKEHLICLYNGLMDSDGYIRENFPDSYSTISKKLADQFQELALKLGKTAVIKEMLRDTKTINNITIKNNHISYNITVRSEKFNRPIFNNKRSQKSHLKEINYEGMVYCVNVPNHIIYIRRNGLCMWIGNCLQELARHRHISLSVKSTRWALKKIKDKITFYHPDTKDNNVILNNLDIKIEEIKELLKEGIESGIPNDILKYYVPESLTTKLILTVNARELRHIFNLRTSNRALREFQVLCMYIYNALPEDHRFMYEDVYKFE